MSDAFQAPRGTLDWLPDRQAARQAMVERFRALCEGAGYREVATPVFEDKALFARTAGESSEVVGKEMYLFEDQGERTMALRPEFTASLVRLYLDHGLSREAQPVRVWCSGSCYRYAAVQRGRYREFTQVDAEAIGSDDPAVDAELIALQLRWYASLGLEGIDLRINTVGDRGDREPYLELLRAYLDAHLGEVDDDVRRQRDLNPLRAFDTKDPASQAVMTGAPKIADHVSPEAREHFAAVRAFLDARGIAYTVDPTLVRGLDYYTRTTWEVAWPELGAQSGIGGGGRFSADARPDLHALLDRARDAGLVCEADLAGRAAKGQFKQADRIGAARTVVCGDDEWARRACLVRDMASGEQTEVPLDALVAHLIDAKG